MPAALPAYHPETVIREWENGQHFSIADATTGVCVFGATGSGKTSGTGRHLALGYLGSNAEMGGIVLCAKISEREQFMQWAKEAGREQDVIVFDASGIWRFNFLEWESGRASEGGGLTINVVALLEEIITALEPQKATGGGDIDTLFSRDINSLPDLRPPNTVVVTSDYSGEHQGATHEVLSFLLAGLDTCEPWDLIRTEVRRKFLQDNRRMSFKDLRDKRRQLALPGFLDAANGLCGLSFTLAINKDLGTLFDGPQPLDLANPEFSEFRDWAPRSLEKTFRIVHVLSFLLAALLRSGQNVLWFTDEDSIAANPARVASLTKLVTWISSEYLTFGLGHLRCGTTACDDGSRRIEDLAAIPDLVAGAVSEQFVIDSLTPSAPLGQVFWIQRSDFSPKTSMITHWLADSSHALKRLVVRLDPGDGPNKTVVSFYHFSNQPTA